MQNTNMDGMTSMENFRPERADRTDSASAGPLEGVVVADFSRVLAGPYCTMLLADLGATVIKVEAPVGDDTRLWIPPHRDGVSTYYLAVNRNKQSIVLDLKDQDDLETAYQIIDRADVFVENFKPGGLTQFGLDAESVAERWPHLIHTSITGFGTAGGASMPGYDLLAQAVSGMMHVTGSQDGPPQRTGVAIFDVIAGLHAAVGILASLLDRGRTSQGQHVSLNLLSSALSSLVNQTEGAVACGNDPMRMGNEHPSLFPYGPFRANDREIVICCGNDSQFRRMVDCLGRGDLADDARFATVEARNANRVELRTAMEAALDAATAEEWFARLQAVGVPCSPILTVKEGVQFAEDLGLEPVVETGLGDDAVPTVRNPIGLSRTPLRYDKAPPALGADGDAVEQWIRHTPAHPASATRDELREKAAL
ncbi:MAG: CaiB/BaiF CoA transferase family protein [Micrococcaceae bacterium]